MRRTALMALVAALLVAAPPARADSEYLEWQDGSLATTFGPSEQVSIGLGRIEYRRDCALGVNDGFIPVADVYVMPAGKLRPGTLGVLRDVNVIPNTVIAGSADGTFFDEQIALTAPGGALRPGTYDVVYDECQDGFFDARDALFRSVFTFSWTTQVPPVPSFAGLKQRAGQHRDRLRNAQKVFTKLHQLNELRDFAGAVVNPTEAVIWAFQNTLKVALKIDPEQEAISMLANWGNHYAGIYADPPDPVFQTVVPLGARFDSPATDPLTASGVTFGTTGSSEEALAAHLLTSLERYQGAQLAGDPVWALVHAEAIVADGTALRARLERTSAAAAAFASAVDDDPRDLDGLGAQLADIHARIVSSGFTGEEVRLAHDLGLTDTQIEQVRGGLAAQDGRPFTRAAFGAAMTELRDTAGLSASLAKLGTDVSAQLVVPLRSVVGAADAPDVSAGGPYTGTAGTAVSFTASPSGMASYDWDMDGDGEFDDATGRTAQWTYTHAADRVVAVHVTAPNGMDSIAYAQVVVGAGSRQPPVLVSVTPDRPVVSSVDVFRLEFTIDADRVIGGRWSLDGRPSPGPSFGSSTRWVGSVPAGVHWLSVDVVDVYGEVTTRGWLLAVRRSVPMRVTVGVPADPVETSSVQPLSVEISNPNGVTVGLASVAIVLPDGAAYVPGSAGGATSSDPSVDGRTLVWRDLSAPAGSSTSVTFSTRMPAEPGTVPVGASASADPFTVGNDPPAAMTLKVPARLDATPLLSTGGQPSARLERADTLDPLPDRTVRFSNGCTATTGPDGVATCSGLSSLVGAAANLGYDATFDGDASTFPAGTHGGVA